MLTAWSKEGEHRSLRNILFLKLINRLVVDKLTILWSIGIYSWYVERTLRVERLFWLPCMGYRGVGGPAGKLFVRRWDSAAGSPGGGRGCRAGSGTVWKVGVEGGEPGGAGAGSWVQGDCQVLT